MSGSKLSATILGVFVLVTLAIGFSIGVTIRPGEWYQALIKPSFTPPNWLFGPVWTLVYILIAIAGWRVALTSGFRSPAFRLWGIQMVLNWAWTPTFFGGHLILPGLVVILALLLVAVLFVIRVSDLVARVCFGPYVLWLAYASTLNAAILFMN